jgi:2,3-dihydroxyphenylpropionate 1,2-dioxygenase
VISLTVCASHAPGMERDVAGVEGRAFRRGLDDARRAVEAFRPDLVVLFGVDHRRVFAAVTPTFALVRSARLAAEGTIPNEPLDIRESLVDELAEALVGSGFDLAVCRDVVLDHGFGQPLHRLLGDPSRLPVVPIAVNAASPPLPRARRVIDFGTSVGALLAPRAERVVVLGTGGLSHSPPTLMGDRHDMTELERRAIREAGLAAAAELIDPDWDRRFLEAIGRWDIEALTSIVDRAGTDAGVGANEVRAWLAAAAAGSTHALSTVVYEPVREWITGMAVAIDDAAWLREPGE